MPSFVAGVVWIQALWIVASYGFCFDYHHRRLQGSRLHSSFDIEAASVKLDWEINQEKSRRPVLDLSSRDRTLDDNIPDATADGKNDMSDWDQGQRWKTTQAGLIDLGISLNSTSLLQKCPQLLRLESSMVLETAQWAVKEFGVDYLASEPRILSYPCSDASYGLEFMSLMMMMPAKAACKASPQLLLAGIEGGLQERAVKAALGEAGEATRNANQKIAGDLGASWKELKKRKGL